MWGRQPPAPTGHTDPRRGCGARQLPALPRDLRSPPWMWGTSTACFEKPDRIAARSPSEGARALKTRLSGQTSRSPDPVVPARTVLVRHGTTAPERAEVCPVCASRRVSRPVLAGPGTPADGPRARRVPDRALPSSALPDSWPGLPSRSRQPVPRYRSGRPNAHRTRPNRPTGPDTRPPDPTSVAPDPAERPPDPSNLPPDPGTRPAGPAHPPTGPGHPPTGPGQSPPDPADRHCANAEVDVEGPGSPTDPNVGARVATNAREAPDWALAGRVSAELTGAGGSRWSARGSCARRGWSSARRRSA